MSPYPFPEIWTAEAAALNERCRSAAEAVRVALEARRAEVGIDAEPFYALLAIDGEADYISTLSRYGIAPDDFLTRCAIIVERMPYTFTETDVALFREGRTPFDPTVNRRLPDGTVRGRRRGEVIDGWGNRATYASALAMANDLLRIDHDGETVDPAYRLIGTDEYSWAEVVHARPTFTVDATGFIRPPMHGAKGIPIVGDPFDPRNRKRRAYRVRKASYRTIDGTTLRMSFDGRYIDGHGTWQDSTRTARHKSKTIRLAAVPTAEVPDMRTAAAFIDEALRSMFDAKRDGRVRVRLADGTTFTVGTDMARERFRLSVKLASESRATPSVHRKLSALLKNVQKYA